MASKKHPILREFQLRNSEDELYTPEHPGVYRDHGTLVSESIRGKYLDIHTKRGLAFPFRPFMNSTVTGHIKEALFIVDELAKLAPWDRMDRYGNDYETGNRLIEDEQKLKSQILELAYNNPFQRKSG